MSSLSCPICDVKLWDKVKGNLRKYQEINNTFYCLKCSKLMRYEKQ
jgi:RNase P subunit RPR2